MYKVLITSPAVHSEHTCDTDEDLNETMLQAARSDEGLCQITVLKKMGRPARWQLYLSMSFTREASEYAIQQRMHFHGK